MTSIAEAASRVAESIRATGYGNYASPTDLAALLPILDAVACGAEGGLPLLLLPELPRPAVRYADDSYPAFSAEQMHAHAEKAVRAFAAALAPGRAAIALADAEAAKQRPTWRPYGSTSGEPPKDVCFDVWAYGRRVVDCYYNGYEWRTYADGDRDCEHVPGVTAYIIAEDRPPALPSTPP